MNGDMRSGKSSITEAPVKHARIVTRRMPVWAPRAPAETGQPDKYHRWREVALCLCCGHHGDYDTTDLIEHDALCIVRIEQEGRLYRGEELLVRGSQSDQHVAILRALFARASALLGQDHIAARRALDAVYAWKPGRWLADPVTPKRERERDAEQAPFFSEAYLYNLVGKEDARTILALLDAVGRAIGAREP